VATDDKGNTCVLLHLNYLPPTITSIVDIGSASIDIDSVLGGQSNLISPKPWNDKECTWDKNRWVSSKNANVPCYTGLAPPGCEWDARIEKFFDPRIKDENRCDAANSLWTGVPTNGTTLLITGKCNSCFRAIVVACLFLVSSLLT
jgi:hypothetical protein